MRFGFETVIWGRRIHDLDLALAQIKACGYEGVEFSQSISDLRIRDEASARGWRPIVKIEQLMRMLRKHGLELVSLAGGPLSERVKFCEGVELPYLYAGVWDAEAESVLKKGGHPVLGLHPHWLMQIDRLAKAREILAKLPGTRLKLLPDTAHLLIAGDDPIATIREFHPRLAGVHLKDWKPSFGRFSHRYAHGFVPLGRGIVPRQAVLEELRAVRFEGWVVVEQDSGQGTPARSAWECAEWLVEHGWLARQSAPPDALLDRDWREARGLSVLARAKEDDFLTALGRATALPLSGFYDTVVRSLQQHLGCPGVSLWSHNATRSALQLVGAAGVTAGATTKLLPWSGSRLESVLRTLRPDYFYLRPEESRVFVSEEWVEKPIDLLAIPIFNNRSAHQLRYLLLVVWPGDRRRSLWFSEGALLHERTPPELQQIEESGLFPLVENVDRMADLLRDELCMAAAGYTSWLCSYAQTRDGLLRALVEHIRATFRCEGVAIFVGNEVTRRLESACSEPETQWRANIKTHERGYELNEGVMGEVWKTGEIRFTVTGSREPTGEQSSWEILFGDSRHEALYFPMAAANGRVVGVIRCTNKELPGAGSVSEPFNDDDAAILDTIVQTALPYLELLVQKEAQIVAVARQIHETKMPLTGLRAAVQWAAQLSDDAADERRQMFGDMWQWTDMLHISLENARLLRPSSHDLILECKPTQLAEDVLVPVLSHARLLLGEEWERAKITQRLALPPLHIDREKWAQIFYNLLSNACKYRGGRPVRISVTGERDASGVVIRFCDYGIGVTPEMRERIFDSGFREPNAALMHTTGHGIGLAVVRSIVTAHGGQARLSHCRRPTTFEIRLPESVVTAAGTTIALVT